MKKPMLLIATLIAAVALTAGCKGKDDDTATPRTDTEQQQPADDSHGTRDADSSTQ